LSAISLANSTPGADTDSGAVNPPGSSTYTVNSPLIVKTRWTRAVRTITLSTTSNPLIDDILYN
jgi:hypothetical protein